jgi:hypothetical protein
MSGALMIHPLSAEPNLPAPRSDHGGKLNRTAEASGPITDPFLGGSYIALEMAQRSGVLDPQ